MTAYVQIRADLQIVPAEHQTGTQLADVAVAEKQSEQEDLCPIYSVSQFSRCANGTVHCGISVTLVTQACQIKTRKCSSLVIAVGEILE